VTRRDCHDEQDPLEVSLEDIVLLVEVKLLA